MISVAAKRNRFKSFDASASLKRKIDNLQKFRPSMSDAAKHVVSMCQTAGGILTYLYCATRIDENQFNSEVTPFVDYPEKLNVSSPKPSTSSEDVLSEKENLVHEIQKPDVYSQSFHSPSPSWELFSFSAKNDNSTALVEQSLNTPQCDFTTDDENTMETVLNDGKSDAIVIAEATNKEIATKDYQLNLFKTDSISNNVSKIAKEKCDDANESLVNSKSNIYEVQSKANDKKQTTEIWPSTPEQGVIIENVEICKEGSTGCQFANDNSKKIDLETGDNELLFKIKNDRMSGENIAFPDIINQCVADNHMDETIKKYIEHSRRLFSETLYGQVSWPWLTLERCIAKFGEEEDEAVTGFFLPVPITLRRSQVKELLPDNYKDNVNDCFEINDVAFTECKVFTETEYCLYVNEELEQEKQMNKNHQYTLNGDSRIYICSICQNAKGALGNVNEHAFGTAKKSCYLQAQNVAQKQDILPEFYAIVGKDVETAKMQYKPVLLEEYTEKKSWFVLAMIMKQKMAKRAKKRVARLLERKLKKHKSGQKKKRHHKHSRKKHSFDRKLCGISGAFH